MKTLRKTIEAFGVERAGAFSYEQQKIIILLLDHGRLTAEQVDCLAENLEYAKRDGIF